MKWMIWRVPPFQETSISMSVISVIVSIHWCQRQCHRQRPEKLMGICSKQTPNVILYRRSWAGFAMAQDVAITAMDSDPCWIRRACGRGLVQGSPSAVGLRTSGWNQLESLRFGTQGSCYADFSQRKSAHPVRAPRPVHSLGPGTILGCNKKVLNSSNPKKKVFRWSSKIGIS